MASEEVGAAASCSAHHPPGHTLLRQRDSNLGPPTSFGRSRLCDHARRNPSISAKGGHIVSSTDDGNRQVPQPCHSDVGYASEDPGLQWRLTEPESTAGTDTQASPEYSPMHFLPPQDMPWLPIAYEQTSQEFHQHHHYHPEHHHTDTGVQTQAQTQPEPEPRTYQYQHLADESCHEQEAQTFMIGTPDDDGDLPIHIATAKEDSTQVGILGDLMHKSGLSLDAFNHLRQTPLHIAVVTQNEVNIRQLLNYGSSACIQDRHGNTAIHLAVKCANKQCLLILLDYSDCDSVIDLHNFDGFAPIHLAVFRQGLDLIRGLSCKNANVDVLDGTGGRSPLFHAVENGFETTVELLLSLGANVNLPNFAGTTPLLVATDRSNKAITSMLLSRGAMTLPRDDS